MDAASVFLWNFSTLVDDSRRRRMISHKMLSVPLNLDEGYGLQDYGEAGQRRGNSELA